MQARDSKGRFMKKEAKKAPLRDSKGRFVKATNKCCSKKCKCKSKEAEQYTDFKVTAEGYVAGNLVNAVAPKKPKAKKKTSKQLNKDLELLDTIKKYLDETDFNDIMEIAEEIAAEDALMMAVMFYVEDKGVDLSKAKELHINISVDGEEIL